MKGCLPDIMGANASSLARDLGPEELPSDERYYGFINFGNTCYCNSVLQALYFCPPFREKVLQYRQQLNAKQGGNKKETLLSCLCDLFHNITTQKKKIGVLQPKKFVTKLRKENEQFDNYMQHDAHEFINYLLNYIADVLKAEKKIQLESESSEQDNNGSDVTVEKNKDRKSVFSRSKKEKIKHDKKRKKIPVNGDSTNGNDEDVSLDSITKSKPRDHTVEEGSTLSLSYDGESANHEKRGSSGADTTTSSTYEVPNESSSKLLPFLKLGRKKRQKSKISRMISEVGEEDHATSNGLNGHLPSSGSTKGGSDDITTWVHEIFQGTLTNETRCLTCETVSSKDEDFLDLSVDVEQNTSITHCLRGFSNTETLSGEHKYNCEVCCSKQEAEKRMRIKKLPLILALHLKRFKMDSMCRYTKLSYRVVFPFELRLFNTSDDATNAERLYDLIAVVVHCGSGPNRGHYITIVKSHGLWLLYDDDIVEKIEPSALEDFYGLSADVRKNSESGYILFYQCKE